MHVKGSLRKDDQVWYDWYVWHACLQLPVEGPHTEEEELMMMIEDDEVSEEEEGQAEKCVSSWSKNV